jgi:uncharacterized protein with HEPN domain
MRNLLAHRYFGIDLDEVWAAAQNDITPLKQAVESILRRLPGDAA